MTNRFASSRSNRPSLGHLILWVSCCAVFFGLSRSFAFDLKNPLDVVLLSSLGAVYGACWAGCLTVIYRYVFTSRPEIAPGEWLLFCLGLIMAVEVLLSQLPEDLVIRKPALSLAFTCAILIPPTLSRRLAGRWKVLFVLFVLAYAAPLSLALAQSLALTDAPNVLVVMQRARPYLILIALAVMVFLDTRTSQKQVWSHWLGIACTTIWLLFEAIRDLT